jgi:hypothetical protein
MLGRYLSARLEDLDRGDPLHDVIAQEADRFAPAGV